MQTLREKITFVLTGLAYLVFHLGTNSTVDNITLGSVISGTIEQLLTTAPYCIGFTFVLVAIIRYMHKGKRLPWDRIARIFFTIGILFGFYFNLYNSGYRAEEERKKSEGKPVSVSESFRHDNPKLPLHWA
jgi:amino acid transporter